MGILGSRCGGTDRSCPAGWVGTLGASDVTVGLGGQVVVLRGVPLDGLLPGERHVLEGVARRAVVARSRRGRDVLLDAVAARRVGHGPASCSAVVPGPCPPSAAGNGERPPPRQGETAVPPCDGAQKAASSTSISALSVFSTMSRSDESRGSTWVAKKRVAASLPS